MKKPVKKQTVAQYLAALPPERRADVRRLRTAMRRAIPKGYRETVAFNSIAWVVPLSVLPDTYNGQPLCYAALGAHQSHIAIHLMGAYGSPVLRKALEDGYKKAGKKLNMGKACLRARSADDVALDVITSVLGKIPMERYVAIYQSVKRR